MRPDDERRNRNLDSLLYCAYQGDLEAVQKALESGTHPDTIYDPGFTLLDAAVLSHRPELIRMLLSVGANVDARAEDGYTLLYRASLNSNQESHFKFALFFLHQGADVNSQGPNGETPLMAAARAGNSELVTAMLAKGADVFRTDASGKCAVDYATPNMMGDTTTIELLQKAMEQR